MALDSVGLCVAHVCMSVSFISVLLSYNTKKEFN